ncbi:MAG: DedA family protein [Candidatus Saccharimonadales bacterium]
MLDPTHLIESGGLLLITAIIFAETGLLIGFFLPGDTLLLSAGIFAAQGKLSIGLTIFAVALASILGNVVGYHIGKKSGKKVFKKTDGILFKKEYIDKAEAFYESHGGKTILFARFIPIVRTFAAVVAGVAEMNFGIFMIYNVLGGILWGGGMTLLGYFVGSRIPNIEHFVLPVILLAMAASFAPMIYHLAKAYLAKRKKA